MACDLCHIIVWHIPDKTGAYGPEACVKASGEEWSFLPLCLFYSYVDFETKKKKKTGRVTKNDKIKLLLREYPTTHPFFFLLLPRAFHIHAAKNTSQCALTFFLIHGT